MRDMAYECGDTAYIDTMQAEEYEMCSKTLNLINQIKWINKHLFLKPKLHKME